MLTYTNQTELCKIPFWCSSVLQHVLGKINTLFFDTQLLGGISALVKFGNTCALIDSLRPCSTATKLLNFTSCYLQTWKKGLLPTFLVFPVKHVWFSLTASQPADNNQHLRCSAGEPSCRRASGPQALLNWIEKPSCPSRHGIVITSLTSANCAWTYSSPAEQHRTLSSFFAA